MDRREFFNRWIVGLACVVVLVHVAAHGRDRAPSTRDLKPARAVARAVLRLVPAEDVLRVVELPDVEPVARFSLLLEGAHALSRAGRPEAVSEALDRLGRDFYVHTSSMKKDLVEKATRYRDDPFSRLITIKPPYKPYPGARADMISLQYALIDVLKQVGSEFYWGATVVPEKRCNTIGVFPRYENEPCRDVLDALLHKKGFRWEVDQQGRVVIELRER